MKAFKKSVHRVSKVEKKDGGKEERDERRRGWNEGLEVRSRQSSIGTFLSTKVASATASECCSLTLCVRVWMTSS